MRVDLFDFELPHDRIALRPARPRDSARLLLVKGSEISDHQVRVLGDVMPSCVVTEEAFGDVPDVRLFPQEEAVIAKAVGKRIMKLPQEFPRANRRRRTWLEAAKHVLQPTDHAGREELLVGGRRGLFGSTGHDPGC